MDATERARLRALRETIPDGDVTPCCGRAGEDGHHSSWALGATPHGAAIRAWVAGPLDLLALARTALPALLDDLDAVERERDEALAELARLCEACPSAIVLRPVDPMPLRGLPCACDEWGTGHLDGCPNGGAESVDGRDA